MVQVLQSLQRRRRQIYPAAVDRLTASERLVVTVAPLAATDARPAAGRGAETRGKRRQTNNASTLYGPTRRQSFGVGKSTSTPMGL